MQLLVGLVIILFLTVLFLLWRIYYLRKCLVNVSRNLNDKKIEPKLLNHELSIQDNEVENVIITPDEVLNMSDYRKNNLEGLLEDRLIALKASEARYSLLVNTVMYPVMVSNLEGNILFINPKCTEYLGITQKDAEDYNTEMFWENTIERILFLNEIKEKSFVSNMEIKFRKLSGQILECLISSNVIDYYGQTSILTVFVDITERKRIEKALAESEILFKSIVDNTNNLICSVAVDDFRLLSFNESLFNYCKLNYVVLHEGMSLFEIYGNEEKVNEQIHLFKQTINEGFVKRNEYFSLKNNRWYDFQLHLLKRDDKPFAIAIYGNDITDIKLKENLIAENEEKLRLMLDNSTDAIGLINEAGEQIFHTEASVRSTGYALDELLGPISDVIYPDDLAIVNEAWQKVLKFKDEVIRVQYRHKHKYNGYIWYEAVARNYLNHPALKAVLINVRDITSLKEAEFKLTAAKEFETRNNERFRTIARLSSHLVYDYDLVNERMYWDGAIKEVTGFEPEEYEHVHFNEWAGFLHPDDKEQALEQYKYAFNEVKPYRAQYRYLCKNGTYKWVEEDSHFIEIKNNRPTRLLGVIKDISEQKATKEKLILNEEKYKLLAENVDDVIWKFDINTYKYTYFSPSVYKLTGYTVTEAVGLTLEDFLMPDSLNDLKLKLPQWVNLCQFDTNESVNRTFEYKIRHKNGSPVYVEINATLIRAADGNITEVLATSRNIEVRKAVEKALRESEEKLRTIFNTANDGIILLDIYFNILDINHAAYSKSGFSKEESLNQNISCLLNTESTNILRYQTELLKSGSSAHNFEAEFLIKAGGVLPVEITATEINFGGQEGVLLVARDISERKQLERELLNSVINTEEQDRLKFSQELHDGIGPIISAIKMYIQLILTPETSMDTVEIAKEAEKLIDEASCTVREISYKLSPHILQNYGLVEAVKAYIDRVSESRNLKITFKFNSESRFSEITETIIYRVLCECFNNSIKHAQARNIDVTLELTGNLLQVNYVDNGNGFDVEKMMQQRKGIGILNMQSRIKSLNGILNIASEPGIGTNIYFKVPV
jgi:PAS domain S-box-containing protein